MSGRRIVCPDAEGSVLEHLTGARRAQLEALGIFEVYSGYPSGADDYLRRAGGAHAILLSGTTPLPLAALERMPELEVISFCGVGAGSFVDLRGAAALGIRVCNVPHATVDAVAEHALALLLAVARRLCVLDRDVRQGRWTQSLPGLQLGGRRLGLIGAGPIGMRFAAMARALGMEVTAWTRHPHRARGRDHGLAFAELDEVLASSDVLSLHLALTPQTAGILGADGLARTKPGVVLINTARGALLDEAALVERLRSGHVAGAGLDVFVDEPLPRGHPLLSLDSVVLTPHVAWNTPEATARLFDTAIANLEAHFRGEPVNVVAAPSGG